jgi:phosphate starvation-inducible protein PhoH
MSDSHSNENAIDIDFTPFYEDSAPRGISNASLNKVKSKYGVTIDATDDAPGVYKIAPDAAYSETYVTQAAEALRQMHKSLAGNPARSANEILNKRNVDTILHGIPGRAVRARTATPVADMAAQTVAPAKTHKIEKAVTEAKTFKNLTFGETPWMSIDHYQRHTLADLHGYISRQNRETFLEEFERKMGVRVQTNGQLGFDVFLPVNHEGPVSSTMISQIEIALMNLQTLREAGKPIRRDTVQNELNQVIAGRLTPQFAKEAATKQTSAPAQVRSEPGMFQIFNTISDAGKKLIAKIALPHIEGRSANQKNYLANMKKSDIAFGVAPAGTGKTFLAVVALTEMLVKGEVDSLVITRPAVEAGEKIGFLPGDMGEKMDPFLVPIYTSFEKILAGGDVQKGKQMLKDLMTAGVIVISPLAFMRGGEFQRKGVLLDEGQNATETQLKMFITRLGVDGRMIVTGDPEQTDLKPVSNSVFLHYARTFETVGDDAITTSWMTEEDAVRHPKMPFILKTLRENPVPEGYNPYAVAGYTPVIAKNTGRPALKP